MPTLSLDDVDLRYEVAGDGPPLVFLHGGWMNGDAWQSQVNRFTPEYEVVTVDLRGHGRTGESGQRRYSVELFTDDVEALLTHLDVDQPVLCGLSLGGMVVQEYLDRHPNQAQRAVVAGPVQSMPPVDVPSDLKPFVSPLPWIAASASFAGPTATFQSLLASVRPMHGGPWLSVDPTVQSWAQDAVSDVQRGEFRKIFRALYDYEPPELSHVSTPTLVVYGDHEVSLVKQQGHRIASAVTDGTVLEIPTAGHLVNQDNPDAFNEALTAFLAGDADRLAS
ncbi:alpha/beta fold hydrolase [Halorientalis brevis]|uniref:Alpha/beta fold hydrolase n=1 Tax=Halorientalis brevis TaxID=1126241 RepID=A0ABD6CGG7_9EURY|nr:alpha/beta hydrolase [Halorientalis brevis]